MLLTHIKRRVLARSWPDPIASMQGERAAQRLAANHRTTFWRTGVIKSAQWLPEHVYNGSLYMCMHSMSMAAGKTCPWLAATQPLVPSPSSGGLWHRPRRLRRPRLLCSATQAFPSTPAAVQESLAFPTRNSLRRGHVLGVDHKRAL